jgi:hypothetical protein
MQLKIYPEYKSIFAYTFTKIVQWICLSTIPIAVLLLTVILPWRGFVPYKGSSIDVIVMSYICSMICVFIGYKWPKWFPWHRWYPTDDVGISLSHLFRSTFLVMPIFGGFLLGILGGSWPVIIPFFLLGGIDLIITFPTDKRVTQWKKEQAPKS